jgi:SRSO17 transposase
VGVFLCYAAAQGHAPLDRRLYLPREWADDPARRKKCHVPEAVVFQERWRIGLEMLARCRAEGLPHGWVAADDEFGRCNEFRSGLREQRERYVLDVPANTLMRDLEAPVRQPQPGAGRPRKTPFVQVRRWLAEQPACAWQTVIVRAGTRQPLQVEALMRRVQARDENRRVGAQERLLVVRRMVEGRPEVCYSLSNATDQVSLAELVQAHAQRHRIEQMLQEGKGESGLGHYEVRSWTGWHHHMTLALLALWFLGLEKRCMGKKKLSGGDRAAGAGDFFLPAAASATQLWANCPTGQPGFAT